MDFDHLFKIVFIGSSGVGKSSLLLQYVNGVYTPSFISTIGVDFFVCEKEIQHQKVKIQLWDTGGQERFRVISQSYYRHADAIVLVYDCTNRETLEEITYWMNEIRKHAKEDTQIILLANKSDLVKHIQVTSLEGQKIATTYNVPLFETSALDRKSIEDPILLLVSKMLNHKKAKQDIIIITETKTKKKCC